MADFKKALKFIFELEYGNSPKKALHSVSGDNGGLTYKGIARNYHQDWSGWVIIDTQLEKAKGTFNERLRMTSELVENNLQLQSMVESFYRKNFWNPIKGDDLFYQATAQEIFQMAIVGGVGTAIKLAQTVAKVVVDGKFGNQSLTAINAINPSFFCEQFTNLEKQRIKKIVTNNPSQKKFEEGWNNRADKINGKNADEII